MHLADVLPDVETLLALEPDELGLEILPVLASWRASELIDFNRFIDATMHVYSHKRWEVETAISEAWTWLEGSALLIPDRKQIGGSPFRLLSRKARRLAFEPNARSAHSARLIPKDRLHAVIREDVWSLYARGKYDQAVFVAMKAVEVAVRREGGFSTKDIGSPLMRKAFDKSTGPLTDMTQEEGERESRAHLFAGAIGSYKNPHSHRKVTLEDPDEAAEIIMLANHLLRIVDDRAIARLDQALALS